VAAALAFCTTAAGWSAITFAKEVLQG